MNFTLEVWRQKSRNDQGRFVVYTIREIPPEASLLEMLDVLNQDLVKKGEDPIAFDHDCREGICGSCGLMVNGRAHGPHQAVATCELRMRAFKDGTSQRIGEGGKIFTITKNETLAICFFDHRRNKSS